MGKPRAAYMPVWIFVGIVAQHERLAPWQRIARYMVVRHYHAHAKLVAARYLFRRFYPVVYRYYKAGAHLLKLLHAAHGHAVAVLMP